MKTEAIVRGLIDCGRASARTSGPPIGAFVEIGPPPYIRWSQ
jgi:hypothetical protein